MGTRLGLREQKTLGRISFHCVANSNFNKTNLIALTFSGNGFYDAGELFLMPETITQLIAVQRETLSLPDFMGPLTKTVFPIDTD